MTPTEIREARELLGWSREEMAAALRCSWWAVRSWEMGTRKPSGPTLVALEGLTKKARRQRQQWQENAKLERPVGVPGGAWRPDTEPGGENGPL